MYIVPLATDGVSVPMSQSRVDAREVVNARVELTDIRFALAGGESALTVALRGNNLFDEEIARSKFDPGNAVIAEWEDPLTYGIELRLDY